MERQRVIRVLGIAIAMTTLAELVYLLVWGLYLFPAGSVAGKVAWTLTCGIAMGSVIGMFVLIFAEHRPARQAAFVAWLATAGVGSYCAYLCSRIDIRFAYFGGEEQTSLFLLGGIIPAVLGGVLYAALLYRGGFDTRQPLPG